MDPGATTVTIFGQEYTVRGGDDPEYVRRIARYLDARMNEVAEGSSQISSLRVAILAALNITDELMQSRNDDAMVQFQQRAEVMARRLEESCS